MQVASRPTPPVRFPHKLVPHTMTFTCAIGDSPIRCHHQWERAAAVVCKKVAWEVAILAAGKDLRNPPLSPAAQALPKRFARALDPLRALRRAPASAGQPPCPLDQRPGLGGAHHLQPRLGDGVSPGISPISESDYSVKYQSRDGRFASLPRSRPRAPRPRPSRRHERTKSCSAGVML